LTLVLVHYAVSYRLLAVLYNIIECFLLPLYSMR
jgi:hypothetical protein